MFGADASLTALSQFVPPGSRLLTLDTTLIAQSPARIAVPTTLTTMSIAFNGSATNVLGQTVVFDYLDGAGVVLASSAALPTTAGSHAASVTIPGPAQARPASSDIQVRMTFSAALVGVLTVVRVGIG